jgi:drug/metabolite transporter (DMT)-like permease
MGLSSAIAFGGGDFTGGYASRRAPSLAVAAGAQGVGLVVLLVPLAAARPDLPPWDALVVAGLAGAFGGLGLLALYRGLALGSMGLVTALSGVGSVLIPLFVSGFVRGAAIAPLQWAGIAVALLATAAASGATLAGVSRAALGLAGLAAVGFGLWFTMLDLAAPHGELWTLVASRAAAALLVGALAVQARALHGLRPLAPLLLLAGTLDVTGNAAFVLARGEIPVGVAAALSGIYPIVTMLLARTTLGERLPRLGLVAVALAVAGVALISLGG